MRPTQRTNPPMAITMGDPSGIGPEIIVKAFKASVPDERLVVFGCPNVMQRAVDVIGENFQVRSHQHVSEARFESDIIEVVQTEFLPAPAQLMTRRAQRQL